jgi:hypothetical protein
MKLTPLLPVAGLLLAAANAGAQFTAGNLAIVRLGDGIQTLANTGNSVFIDQYTTSGSFVNSVAIPDSGAAALITTGTSTSEAALVRSTDGTVLTLAGYNTAQPYTGNLTQSAASAVPRALGQVDAAGNYTLVTTTTTMFGGNTSNSGQLRSAVTDGAGNYWGVGTSSATATRGVYHFGLNSAAATLVNNISPRVVDIVSGNLTYSLSSATAGVGGIYAFAGTPTGAATATQIISMPANWSPYDFAFNPTLTLAYIADDRNSASGGIQRWDFSAGSWSLTYTLGTGVANIGARSLAVDFSGADPVIYAVSSETSNNRLISLTDVGVGSTAATLANAGANTVFRGMDFAAIPEPGTGALLGLAGLFLMSHLRSRRMQ